MRDSLTHGTVSMHNNVAIRPVPGSSFINARILSSPIVKKWNKNNIKLKLKCTESHPGAEDSIRATKFHLKIRSDPDLEGHAGRQDVLINTGSICALRPARTCDLKSFPAFGGGPNLRLLLLWLCGHWEGRDWTNKETISMRLSALWGVQNTGDQEVPLLSCCSDFGVLKSSSFKEDCVCVCVCLVFLDVILYGGARETARERYRAIKFGVINYNHKKRMGNMFWLFTHRRQWTDASGTGGK